MAGRTLFTSVHLSVLPLHIVTARVLCCVVRLEWKDEVLCLNCSSTMDAQLCGRRVILLFDKRKMRE